MSRDPVDVDNPAARRLYLRLGYRPTGVLNECTYRYLGPDCRELIAAETSEILVKELPTRPTASRPWPTGGRDR